MERIKINTRAAWKVTSVESWTWGLISAPGSRNGGWDEGDVMGDVGVGGLFFYGGGGYSGYLLQRAESESG